MDEQHRQFVLLDVARWFLCLPQADVISVEMFNDVLCQRKGKTFHWSIKYKNLKIPVFALDEQALNQPLEDLESGMVTIFGNDQLGYMGLTSQDMEVVSGDFLENLSSLPSVMQQAEELFDGVFFVDQRLVCMTNATKLIAYISNLDKAA